MKRSITKKQRVLKAFLAGEKHTRFSAEKYLHDHCLHSTVSHLQKDLGINISREFIIVPGFEGQPTRCCLYWMSKESIDRYYDKNRKQPAVYITGTNGRIVYG